MIARAPTLRAEFAQRLRRLRIERGYKRARHLAESLGIDENRYTRYERAETEPDISLLSQICSKLAVTPNTLFGIDGLLALDLEDNVMTIRRDPAQEWPALIDEITAALKDFFL